MIARGAIAVGTMILVAGCAAPATGGASAEAEAFVRAASAKDGAAACRLLVPDAAGGLESGGSSCAEEVIKLELSTGPAHDAEIWGDYARVGIGAQTVFLTRWDGSWRVTAAGCEPRENKPYDCEVEA